MDDSKKSVLRQYHQELRTGVLVLNFLPTLHPLLTEVEYQLIVDKQGNVAMVDELIATLLTKENKHFDGFCTALRKHGYPQWANKLQNMPQGDVNTEPSPGDPSVNLEPTPTLSPVASEGENIETGIYSSFEGMHACFLCMANLSKPHVIGCKRFPDK